MLVQSNESAESWVIRHTKSGRAVGSNTLLRADSRLDGGELKLSRCLSLDRQPSLQRYDAEVACNDLHMDVQGIPWAYPLVMLWSSCIFVRRDPMSRADAARKVVANR